MPKSSAKKADIPLIKPAAKRRATATDSSPKTPQLKLPPDLLLGAHTSTSGGLFRAVERSIVCGFNTAQIFVKNNKQWFAPPLLDTEVKEFKSSLQQANKEIFAHNSYLINLASPNDEIFLKSIDAMSAEVERAEALGLPFIVMHPGSHVGSGETVGLERITDGLEKIVKRTAGFKCRLALEITAGQGNSLGHRLEHLATLLEASKEPSRLAVCLDTAHLHAAGYPLSKREEWEETMGKIAKIIGVEKVVAWHFNDTNVKLGKKVDRHIGLGEGEIGLDCFAWIVQDPRWAKVPKVLETPKSEDMHEDVENIKKLASHLQISL